MPLFGQTVLALAVAVSSSRPNILSRTSLHIIGDVRIAVERKPCAIVATVLDSVFSMPHRWRGPSWRKCDADPWKRTCSSMAFASSLRLIRDAGPGGPHTAGQWKQEDPGSCSCRGGVPPPADTAPCDVRSGLSGHQFLRQMRVTCLLTPRIRYFTLRSSHRRRGRSPTAGRWTVPGRTWAARLFLRLTEIYPQPFSGGMMVISFFSLAGCGSCRQI